MRIDTTLIGLSRCKQEQVRLSLTFRNAVLDYCSSPELLKRWKDKQTFEYKRSVHKGFEAIRPFLSDREAKGIRVSIDIR